MDLDVTKKYRVCTLNLDVLNPEGVKEPSLDPVELHRSNAYSTHTYIQVTRAGKYYR